jgi:hypothetical protein
VSAVKQRTCASSGNFSNSRSADFSQETGLVFLISAILRSVPIDIDDVVIFDNEASSGLSGRWQIGCISNGGLAGGKRRSGSSRCCASRRRGRRRCGWNVFGESNDGVVGTGGVVLSRGVAGAGHAVFAFENVFGRTCVAVGAGAEVGAFGVCGEGFGVVGVPRYCRFV